MKEVKRADITLQDCEELYTKFKRYTETAEQHEFPLLAVVNVMLDGTMLGLRAVGRVENQKDILAMFRVVLRVIGEDFSMYEEADE